MKVPYIPADAPFNDDQRSWLSGFLAGLHSRKVMGLSGQVATATAPIQAKPLNILYGTQTGNAEGVANEAAALAKARGFAPNIQELDAIDMTALAAMETVIVVISTYGEGEMPDNAHIFWEALSASTAPRLENLSYGILALGDTSYDYFCQAGKMLDTRFEQLGATRLGARVDCDVDYEDAATAWLDQTMPVAQNGQSEAASTTGTVVETQSAKKDWGRKNPYPANILENRCLSGDGSAKEIRHIAFDLGESGLSYEAGDALGVMPVNSPALVSEILARLQLKDDQSVTGQDLPLGTLLATKFEIMTPSKDVIQEIEKRAGDAELSHIVGNNDKEALAAYLWGKDCLDLLNLNKDVQISADEFISWLRPLQHRAYSISSSPKAHPGEVHLTVAAVRWHADNREHKGVCSTYLADMAPEGHKVGIFMSPNKNFRVPQDDSVPMIMVGPGTGIAPFRAFLEERRERGAKGRNWLFFGDQHRKTDFIYEDELSEMHSAGLLSQLDLAFSRDQAEKIYVQNRMIAQGTQIFAALEEGGYFYVCGDATRMAKDVDAALHQIIKAEGKLDDEAAEAYVNHLKRDKRYVRDVY